MEIPDNIVKIVATALIGGTVVTGGGFGGKALYDQYKQDHDLIIELKTKIDNLEKQVTAQWRRIGGQ